MARPLIGITLDLGPHAKSGRATCSGAMAYAECVTRAGGIPVFLPPIPELVHHHLAACDGFVLTGGGDPRMEEFGEPTHAKAEVMDPQRQAYEVTLLRALEDQRPEAPVLGVCLGMQLLSLVSGGKLNQHLPETHGSHADHYSSEHEVKPLAVAGGHPARRAVEEFRGLVASHHRQAVKDAGRLEVLAVAHDGVIEAVADPRRPFCLGVQWHPERTSHQALGQDVFGGLVAAVG